MKWEFSGRESARFFRWGQGALIAGGRMFQLSGVRQKQHHAVS